VNWASSGATAANQPLRGYLRMRINRARRQGQERKRSVQGPDTEAQDLSPPHHHFPLATRGRSIQLGSAVSLECAPGAGQFEVAARLLYP
jgi:hypothetical protein